MTLSSRLLMLESVKMSCKAVIALSGVMAALSITIRSFRKECSRSSFTSDKVTETCVNSGVHSVSRQRTRNIDALFWLKTPNIRLHMVTLVL